MTHSLIRSQTETADRTQVRIAGAIGSIFTLLLEGAGSAALALGSGLSEAISRSRSPSTARLPGLVFINAEGKLLAGRARNHVTDGPPQQSAAWPSQARSKVSRANFGEVRRCGALLFTTGSPFARAIRIILDELNVKYEKREELTTPSVAQRAAASPTLQVPTYWDGDLRLWESGLIAEYLLHTYQKRPDADPPLHTCLAHFSGMTRRTVIINHPDAGHGNHHHILKSNGPA